MAKTIKVDEMAETISRMMADWSQDVADAVKEAVTEVAKDTVSDLRQNSPVRKGKGGGKYARGWTTIVTAEDRYGKKETVYNRSQYRITHLLEFGHAKVNGGRVRAIPHIEPAERRAIESLEEKVRQKINDVS